MTHTHAAVVTLLSRGPSPTRAPCVLPAAALYRGAHRWPEHHMRRPPTRSMRHLCRNTAYHAASTTPRWLNSPSKQGILQRLSLHCPIVYLHMRRCAASRRKGGCTSCSNYCKMATWALLAASGGVGSKWCVVVTVRLATEVKGTPYGGALYPGETK